MAAMQQRMFPHGTAGAMGGYMGMGSVRREEMRRNGMRSDKIRLFPESIEPHMVSVVGAI